MISVSHARPVAGRTFVGIVITPQTVIQKVNLRGNIRGWVSRFHAAGKPPVIVCWWRIPAGARGTLKTRIFADGTPIGSVYRWRIRH